MIPAKAAAALREPAMRGKIVLFLGNFGLAKIAIYFAPLAVAAFAAADIYAGVELAMSTGLLVGAFLVSAPLSGITQRYLVSGERRIVDQTAAVLVGGCVIALFAFAATNLAHSDPSLQLIAASLGAAVMHQIGSSTFRMLGRRNLAAWADGTAVIVGVSAVVAAVALPGPATVAALACAYALIALAGLAAGLLVLARSRSPALLARLRAATAVGLPMMVVATLATWLGVGGRILFGLLNPDALAAYGVAFRIAGLALGLHQLAMIALFAYLYAARTKVADPIIAGFVAGTAVLCAALAVAGQFVPDFISIGALSGAGVQLYRDILPLTALHTFFWIGYGMLQFRVSRAKLATGAIAPTALVTFVGIAGIVAVGHWVTASAVVLSWLVAVHAAVYFFKNVYLLARAGLPHRMTTWAGVAGGGLLTTVALLSSTSASY